MNLRKVFKIKTHRYQWLSCSLWNKKYLLTISFLKKAFRGCIHAQYSWCLCMPILKIRTPALSRAWLHEPAFYVCMLNIQSKSACLGHVRTLYTVRGLCARPHHNNKLIISPLGPPCAPPSCTLKKIVKKIIITKIEKYLCLVMYKKSLPKTNFYLNPGTLLSFLPVRLLSLVDNYVSYWGSLRLTIYTTRFPV